MSEEKLTLDLGQEELVVLLWLLRTPTLPGLGADPLQGLKGEVAAQALASAERSLRARGLLVVKDEGPLEIDATVMALVGTCVIADSTLVCTTAENDGAFNSRYLYSTKHLIVEHTNSESGIHHFETVAGKKGQATRIIEALDLQDTPAPSGSPIIASEKQIQELTASLARLAEDAAMDPAAAERSGLKADSVNSLLSAFSALKKVALVAVRRRSASAQAAADAMVLLQSAEGYWSMEPTQKADKGNLYLRPMSTADVHMRIASLLEA